MTPAVLYLPDSDSHLLAARAIAGRSLTVRALVAAARAGAVAIGVPTALRDADLERALRRLPAVAGAIRWLDGNDRSDPEMFSGEPCVLLPASALMDARAVGPLFHQRRGPVGTALAASTASGAPVLLAPAVLVTRLWAPLAAGRPIGDDLIRYVAEARPEIHRASGEASGTFVAIRDESGLAVAEAALYRNLGTEADTGVDQFLHRRCSRWITRLLVRTKVTPNQVSLASLLIGGIAIWAFWNATPLSALIGVLLYALACIVDHSDGELARLTFQESSFGAHLDWAIDTAIHSVMVLAMAVTAGGAPSLAFGVAGAIGVILSALLARALPQEIEVGQTIGGVLKGMGNRDLFYLLLLAFVLLRWMLPALLPALMVMVALGSQAYWIACVVRIHRTPPAA